MTFFQGKGCRMTKMSITFSVRIVPNDVLKFFPFKNPYRLNENQKTYLGHIFPCINGSIGPIGSKNNRVHPWMDPHQPCQFQENRSKTATCIIRSYT